MAFRFVPFVGAGVGTGDRAAAMGGGAGEAVAEGIEGERATTLGAAFDAGGANFVAPLGPAVPDAVTGFPPAPDLIPPPNAPRFILSLK